MSRAKPPAAVALLVALAVSCHAAEGSQVKTSGSQAAIRAGNGYGLAGTAGTLHGDATSGCLWLTEAVGQGTNISSQFLLYGPYTVTWKPLTLYRAGKVKARAGQKVYFSGGIAVGQAGVPGCPVSAKNLLALH